MKKKEEKPVISPSTRTLIIEEVIGDHKVSRHITLPRRRPFKQVYEIKLVLLGTNPPVWRSILVPENYTFYDLHVAIQNAMPWQDYHLHGFLIPSKDGKRKPVHIECPWNPPEYEGEDWTFTTEVPLKKYLKKPSDKVLYLYDYGDSWEMDVILERIRPVDKRRKYPSCIDGEMAAPPEDCGGIPGYYSCIDAVKTAEDWEKNPKMQKSEEIIERLTWLGDWDPYTFNPKKVVFEDPREHFIIGL